MKKLSKRLLSVLLSALLVMTSLPLFAFSAAAADTSALDEAMAAYEAKMDGNFYLNMKDAYDAYVAAAAVKANENASASDIANAASALTAAVDAMYDFYGHTAVGQAIYGTTDENPNQERYAGILWADGSGDTAYNQSQGGKVVSDDVSIGSVGVIYGGYYWFYYPTNSVIMYDGRYTPVLPIMMGAQDKDSNYNIHPRYLYPRSEDFEFTDDWVGYDDNFVWPATDSTRISYNPDSPQSIDDAFEMDNTSTVRSFGNYLVYTGTPTDTLTTINGMTFIESHSMDVVIYGTVTSENKELDMNIPIRVINYKKLLDKLSSVGGQYHSALDKVADYKEGGLSQLINAIDYATKDPNSFFETSNQYQACADWIDAAIAGFNDITVTMDPAAAQSIEGAAGMLDSFENILNNTNGKYYKNILPVYELYVKLHATVDAYEYGDGTSEAIGVASEALSAGIQGLQEFTPYTASGTVTMKSDTTAVSDSRYVSGLIGNYTASTSTMSYSSATTQNSSYTSPGGVYAFVNSPTSVVALYDGSTAIRIPVMTAWHNNMGFAIGTGNRRMMNAVYPSDMTSTASPADDNADFEMTQKWNGHTYDTWSSSTQANNAFRWNDAMNPASSRIGTLDGYSKATYNAADDDNYSENPSWQGQRSTTLWAYWNFMTYKGGESGFSNGLKTVKVNFYGMSKWPKAAIDTEGKHYFGSTSTPVTTVSIIDYKTPIDTFKSNWASKMAEFASGNYDEGGYAAVFAAFDDFTSYNGLATATPSNAATVASNLITKANATGTATATANGTEYQALRDKITWYPTAEKYVTGMSDPTFWTEDSWAALIDAIDAAEAIMTALPSNAKYFYLDPAAAAAAAQAIQTAYDNLVEAGILINPAVEAYSDFSAAIVNHDYVYSATSLKAAKVYFESLTTTYYTGTIGTKIPANDANRQAIAAEEAALVNALNALETQDFDKDSYNTYIEAAHRGVNDPDAYDIEKLSTDIETLENAAFETVDIGTQSIIGLKDDAQNAVDNAYAAVQSDLTNKMQYTVKVVDVDGNELQAEAKYEYGTSITVNQGTADYTYDYVSNTSNTEGKEIHRVKNIGTVDSFTFTVQGNTTITVGKATNNKPIKVTYKAVLAPMKEGEASNTFVIGTDYVAAGTTISAADFKAPSYAFYSYQGFTQNTDASGNITVTLNYDIAGGAARFEVYDGSTGETEEYYFNELVTVVMEDAVIISSAETKEAAANFYDIEDYEAAGQFLTPLAYGNTYTFRAKENLYLVDIWCEGDEVCLYTQDDETGTVSPVYVRTITNKTDDTLVTYNTVALPDGYSIVEAGILVQYNKDGESLLDRALNFNTVGDDLGSDKIRRLKGTKIFTAKDGEDNRYTINATIGSGKARYLAYVNYTDADGNAHTVFSDVTDVISIG